MCFAKCNKHNQRVNCSYKIQNLWQLLGILRWRHLKLLESLDQPLITSTWYSWAYRICLWMCFLFWSIFSSSFAIIPVSVFKKMVYSFGNVKSKKNMPSCLFYLCVRKFCTLVVKIFLCGFELRLMAWCQWKCAFNQEACQTWAINDSLTAVTTVCFGFGFLVMPHVLYVLLLCALEQIICFAQIMKQRPLGSMLSSKSGLGDDGILLLINSAPNFSLWRPFEMLQCMPAEVSLQTGPLMKIIMKCVTPMFGVWHE